MRSLKRGARFIIAITGFLGIFFAPPYVPMICILLLCFRFRAWEAICIGFAMDMVWLPATSFAHMPLFTLAAIAMVWGLEPLRLQFLR
jgi:hypothetical protein